jgi:hypothetical protein
MSTCDPPREPDFIVKSRKAAYCAVRRLNGARDLTAQQMSNKLPQHPDALRH